MSKRIRASEAEEGTNHVMELKARVTRAYDRWRARRLEEASRNHGLPASVRWIPKETLGPVQGVGGGSGANPRDQHPGHVQPAL